MKDPMLISIFLDELKTALGNMAGVLSSPDSPATAEQLQKIISSLKGSAKLAGLELVFLLLSEFETVLAKYTASSRGLEPPAINLFNLIYDRLTELSEKSPEETEAYLDESGNPYIELRISAAALASKIKDAPAETQSKGAKAEGGKAVDPFMLEMFYTEFTDNTAKIRAAISGRPDDPVKASQNLTAWVNAIKGASKIASCTGTFTLFDEIEKHILTLENNFEKISAYLSGYMTAFEGTVNDAVDDKAKALLLNPPAVSEVRTAPAEQAVRPEKPEKKEEKAPAPSGFQIDESMVELFIMELEGQSKVLEKGLIKAENSTNPSELEPLMRAAHSVKGAARIVGLNQAVELAHAMEDLLSAAMHGKLILSGMAVDELLKANDILKDLSVSQPSVIAGRLAGYADTIKYLSKNLRSILEGGSISDAPPPQKPAPQAAPDEKKPAAPAAQKNQQKDKEESQYVRVLAENLNKMLGLSGEIKIKTRFSKPFYDSMVTLKSYFHELTRQIEQMRSVTEGEEIFNILYPRFEETANLFERIDNLLEKNITKYDQYSRNLEQLAETMNNEVVLSKMRPFGEVTHGLPRMIRDLCKRLEKKVDFEIIGINTKVDRDILEKLESPLSHLIANAIDHGIEKPEKRISKGKPEEGKVILEAAHRGGMLHITIKDDGKGVNKESMRRKIVERGYTNEDIAEKLTDQELLDFLFLPGFSTTGEVTEVSGRGVGLDIVQTLAHQLGGSVRVESEENAGTTFILQLPITLSVIKALIVTVHNERYAIPLARIERILSIGKSQVSHAEDRQYYRYLNENIGIIEASQVLQLPYENPVRDILRLLILNDGISKIGLVVDSIQGERDLVVMPLDQRLRKIPNVSAGSIIEDGSIALILDADDIVKSVDSLVKNKRPQKITFEKKTRKKKSKRILVVDDSLTVREVERRLLENAGYEVAAAVDGLDGYNTLQKADFDLVLTDVDMPRMNGIQFVEKIRSEAKYKEIPIMIVSYKDREEDRINGLRAGANYYLTKSSFHDESLIAAVKDLIGEP